MNSPMHETKNHSNYLQGYLLYLSISYVCNAHLHSTTLPSYLVDLRMYLIFFSRLLLRLIRNRLMANGAIFDSISRLKILRLLHNFMGNLF